MKDKRVVGVIDVGPARETDRQTRLAHAGPTCSCTRSCSSCSLWRRPLRRPRRASLPCAPREASSSAGGASPAAAAADGPSLEGRAKGAAGVAASLASLQSLLSREPSAPSSAAPACACARGFREGLSASGRGRAPRAGGRSKDARSERSQDRSGNCRRAYASVLRRVKSDADSVDIERCAVSIKCASGCVYDDVFCLYV